MSQLLTSVGVAAVRALLRLPLPLQLRIGTGVGRLGYWFARRRRHIAATNLRLCFPEMSVAAREQLLKASFRSTGIALIETAHAWLSPQSLFNENFDVQGLDLWERAHAQGKGVMLVGAHFSTLDLAGALLSQQIPLHVMYRYNKNPRIEKLMVDGRQRLYRGVIERDDVRALIRALRSGHTVWYAADQDYGRKHSVFAPFFGVPAATITAVARIARLTGAVVLFCSHLRSEQPWRLQVTLSPWTEDWPTGDDVADATCLNRTIEQHVRIDPAQYLWLHRRFKTRPLGEPRPY